MSIGQWEAIADIAHCHRDPDTLELAIGNFPSEETLPQGCEADAGGVWRELGDSRAKSARVGFINDHVMAAALAPDAQERGLVLRVLRQPHGVFGIFDRLTIDLKNDVTRF